MKLKFKHQAYQAQAVEAVLKCFEGQPFSSGLNYRIDPGRLPTAQGQAGLHLVDAGLRNAELKISNRDVLTNVQALQREAFLPVSEQLVPSSASGINLDVEMETGTGKTYCYIKTIFELHREKGWSKFIIIVPSIAIREGVLKSFEVTAEHFQQDYNQQARFFVYNSKQLHQLESFSSDGGIQVMIINVQAFNSTGKDQRRIEVELDEFQSRRPIDVIKANRPILILDEPQRMEGPATQRSLAKFDALFTLRYSATHKTEHNKIHRLDALDAYNQKLVKKIAVWGIQTSGLSGTSSYLYLEGIDVARGKPPEARIVYETPQGGGIRRIRRKLRKNDNLQQLTGLNQYQGYSVADIDARDNFVEFSNGERIYAGQVRGDISEQAIRRIQIRETINAHLDREALLFEKGIKVLSLFFIDEVAKYRQYTDAGEEPGEYAKAFEEEYTQALNERLDLLSDGPYAEYLRRSQASVLHNGYFSIDKKTRRFKDSDVVARGEMAGESQDVDAYDLILKDKERLLSFEEPTRFIFSHSALREGWDNPNVFVICTLKQSDSNVRRRQEVGRGLRIAVNHYGERMDDPGTVHDINVLTVIASESYKEFVAGLQRDLREAVAGRPVVADAEFFKAKQLASEGEGGAPVEITPLMARQIDRYLVKNDYTDDAGHVTQNYHDAKGAGTLAVLPPELEPYKASLFALIDTIFSDAQMPDYQDARNTKANPLNDNFSKAEFQALWAKINKKAAYTVDFDTNELIEKCVGTLNTKLIVNPLKYTIERGEQNQLIDPAALEKGKAFAVQETRRERHEGTIGSAVRYDLLGEVAARTGLRRRTVAEILSKVSASTFKKFAVNPEEFLTQVARHINEQKGSIVIEHLSYNRIDGEIDIDIFTQEKPQGDFSTAIECKRHVYDYVFTDSKTERDFVQELDTAAEVVVYSKLPRGFQIPTPVGNYNPDWAIVFEADSVKHVYFIAETKGSMSSLELRDKEKHRIACARKFFATITEDQVRYDVVDSYSTLSTLLEA